MRVPNGDLLHIINLDQEHHILTRPTSASCVLFEAHESMQLGSRGMVCPLRAKQAQPASHIFRPSASTPAVGPPPCSAVQQRAAVVQMDERIAFPFHFSSLSFFSDSVVFSGVANRRAMW